MFTHEMKEKDQQIINLPRVKYESFKLILQYLYTDSVPLTYENSMDIFQLADLFQIERLKTLAENKMLNSFSIDNVALIFLEAS